MTCFRYLPAAPTGLLFIASTVLLCACPAPDAKSDDANAGTTGDETDGATSQGPGETDPDPDDGTTTGPDTDTETETDTDEASFIIDPTEGVGVECSVWDQDCPAGEKCAPWASDGGTAWNATKCVALDPSPGQPGDGCSVEGSGVSGVDSCELSTMCWNVDQESNEGTCVAFCSGSESNPVCDDPSTSCIIANDGVLNLCLPSCDPLLQDCEDGQACYPSDRGFVCAPDASGPDLGDYGSPCEFTNACDPGLLCASAAAVPGCTGSMGCCSEFCDLSIAEPSAGCSGLSGGQECVATYAEGDAPPGLEDVGLCAIPE